jgi:DNA-binding beta-propeller fold protein YncE
MRYPIAIPLLLTAAVWGQEPLTLTLKSQIDLPNVNGRIDHFSADLKNHRLFMSALGNHTVEVLDVEGGKRLHTIPDLAEPQGVLYDPGTNHVFVACAKDGTTKIFDGSSFQLLATVKFSDDADNIRYDARARRIIVGYGDGALGFLDSDGKKVGEIALDGHPESFQLEKLGTRVFINVPGRRKLEVADMAKNAVVAKWSVPSALMNYPMSLDEVHHRLFIGCRLPARLVVLDSDSGTKVESVEIVGDTDDLFYDASKGRVYVIGGGGFVDAFDQKDPDHYTRIAHIPTAAGARTGLFVPEWGQLFIAVPHRGEQISKILIYQTK